MADLVLVCVVQADFELKKILLSAQALKCATMTGAGGEVFEAGSCCVVQTGLKLRILIFPKC